MSATGSSTTSVRRVFFVRCIALIPSAAASAIWYAFLVAAGAALGHNFEAAVGLINRANRVLALATLLAVMLLALWLWRHYRQRGEG